MVIAVVTAISEVNEVTFWPFKQRSQGIQNYLHYQLMQLSTERWNCLYQPLHWKQLPFNVVLSLVWGVIPPYVLTFSVLTFSSFLLKFFCLIPCSWLSWLPVSFWLHVSYRIVKWDFSETLEQFRFRMSSWRHQQPDRSSREWNPGFPVRVFPPDQVRRLSYSHVCSYLAVEEAKYQRHEDTLTRHTPHIRH